MTRDEILELPISRITDGWVLRTGQLHLEVDCGGGKRQYVSIDRDRMWPDQAPRKMEELGISYA